MNPGGFGFLRITLKEEPRLVSGQGGGFCVISLTTMSLSYPFILSLTTRLRFHFINAMFRWSWRNRRRCVRLLHINFDLFFTIFIIGLCVFDMILCSSVSVSNLLQFLSTFAFLSSSNLCSKFVLSCDTYLI